VKTVVGIFKEDSFRSDFSVALEPEVRGRAFDTVVEHLKRNYPDACQKRELSTRFRTGSKLSQATVPTKVTAG
jgi:hypothetical protein